MSNLIEHADRTPWEISFPDVVTFCTTEQRDKMGAYTRAKYAKNPNQAEELMYEISHHGKGYKKAIEKIKAIGDGDDIVIIPIHSLEQAHDPLRKKLAVGSNPLPLSIAMMISDETGWAIDTQIVQKNIVGHTGAEPLERFAYPALFGGEVAKGKKYLIVDDHVSMGGTVTNCRGYINKNGGQVIGMASLSSARGGLCPRLVPRTRNRLYNSENFSMIGCHAHLCDDVFGYPLDHLTNSEASQVFYQLEAGRRKKPQYNLQNFFDDVIKCRKTHELKLDMSDNKKLLVQQKLDGSFTSKHLLSCATSTQKAGLIL